MPCFCLSPQACRGDKFSETVRKTGERVELESLPGVSNIVTSPVEIPLQKDYYIVFSSPPGTYIVLSSWLSIGGDDDSNCSFVVNLSITEESNLCPECHGGTKDICV